MNEATKNKAYAARPQSELKRARAKRALTTGTFAKCALAKRALVFLLALSLLLTACGKKQGGGEGGNGGNGSGGGTGGSGGVVAEGGDTSTSGYTRAEQIEELSRAIAKKNQEFNVEDAEITQSASDLPAAKKNYTLMVYMIGSNLESKNGCASADISEMLKSGIDLADTNVILYTGGSQRWSTDIPCDRNCVVDLARPAEEWVVASTEKNADMGASQTLSEFVDFAAANYPADHYALIFWDHGGGPLWGYGVDELFSGDGLLLAEMVQAMDETVFNADANDYLGQKLDFVGFDACLMGNFETMAIWAEYARYFVGSEELEPGDGWNYSFLSVMNETDDPIEITSAIVDAYGAYYEGKQSEFYHPDCTLAVADLSKVGALLQALGAFGDTIASQIEQGSYAAVQTARESTKSFGIIGSEEDRSIFAYDLVDIGSLTEQFSGMAATEAGVLAEAATQLIIKNYTNVDGAAGVSVYFPSGNKAQYYEMRETYSNLAAYGYTRLFEAMSTQWQSAEAKSYTIPALTMVGDEYQIQLDPALLENLSKVTYTIVEKPQSGIYETLVTGCVADVDENGVAHLPKDPNMVVMTAGDSFTVWTVAQAQKTDKRILYQTRNTSLSSSGISFYTRNSTETVPITIVLAEDLATGKLSIQTVNGTSDNAMFSGKETVDVTHFDSIYYYNYGLIPAVTPNGDLLPVSSWDGSDMTYTTMSGITDSFGFDLKPLSECGNQAYYVVTVEDVYGTLYTAKPQKIEPETTYTIKDVNTANGVLTYALFENEAWVAGYTGTDPQLIIPGEVDGKPVTTIMGSVFGRMIIGETTGHFPLQKVILPDSITRIEGSAFRYCYDLTQITLPKNLEYIGSGAFEYCFALEKIDIPSTVKYIGAYAFSDCQAITSLALPDGIEYIGEGITAGDILLEDISFAGGSGSSGAGSKSANGRYEVIDGALYDQEEKILIAYPCAKDGSLTIAPGTLAIGADAISYGKLSSVTLPEGLKTLENYCFYDCQNLAMPTLPESLESIGHYAFCSSWYELDTTTFPDAPEVIHIGKNVTFIGEEAFSLFPYRTFEADSENPRFTAKDGALMNKAGDAVVFFAWNPELTLICPEGSATFSLNLLDESIAFSPFSNLDAMWHVYIPSSVIRITGSTLNEGDVVFHCEAGSYAETAANMLEIPVNYDNEPAIKTVKLPTAAGELTFQLTETHAAWTKYEGSDTEITIPETVEGLPVAVIGDGFASLEYSYSFDDLWVTLPETIEIIQPFAFQYSRMELKNLPEGIRVIGEMALNGPAEYDHLPSSLEYIGKEALSSYSKIGDTLTIPASLTDIEGGAFGGVQISSFAFANGSDSQGLYTIREGMLYNADGTVLLAAVQPDASGEIIIPEGTEAIGPYAFYQSAITSIEIPSSVKEISERAFNGCNQLTEIEFNEGLETIGSHAFMYSALTKLKLPESLKTIGDYAFYSCEDLAEAEIHAEVIQNNAFGYCESIDKITLCEGIRVIEYSAFWNTAVSKITLPDSLVAVGNNAFNNYNETMQKGTPYKLTIGPNLVQIGERAFSYLPISEYNVSPDNPNYCSVDGLLLNKAGTCLISAPSSLSGKVTIPDGIYQIKACAFADCPKVTDITIPASVEIISGSSFTASPWDNASKTITLHAAKDTYAYRWAKDNGWKVKEK